MSGTLPFPVFLGPVVLPQGGCWRAELDSFDTYHDDLYYRVVVTDVAGTRRCFFVRLAGSTAR